MGALAISGSIWEGSGATIMSRSYLNSGSAITQATISTLTYKVFDLSSTAPTTATSTGSFTVASVVFDTLQTDAIWTADSTGYNFKAAMTAASFPDGDRVYRVEVKFTPSSGQAWYQVWLVDSAETYSE